MYLAETRENYNNKCFTVYVTLYYLKLDTRNFVYYLKLGARNFSPNLTFVGGMCLRYSFCIHVNLELL